MTTRIVIKARLGAGVTGAITGYRNVHITHVGVDGDDFPAVWFETNGAAGPGDEHDIVELRSVMTGQPHDEHGHHVGTYVHRYAEHHVYATITRSLEPMGQMRVVPA